MRWVIRTILRSSAYRATGHSEFYSSTGSSWHTVQRDLRSSGTERLSGSHLRPDSDTPAPSWVIQAKSSSHFTVILTPPQGGNLGLCSTCRVQNPITYFYADFHRTDRSDPLSHWTITPLLNGKVALRNGMGYQNYLEYAAGLYDGLDGGMMEHNSIAPGAEWTVVDLHNGRYALQAVNGKYLGYCDGCVGSYGQFYAAQHIAQQATVNFTDPMAQIGTQFSVTCAPVPGNDCQMTA